ncbi:MAG TPA: ribosome-associated translation inhibitor RaiA [Nitrospirota bacterium]|nr:ribosome-associated translation inhibitor RaiA [Nitrospirota bacterium]
MQVTVLGRHIEVTDALKQYATEKFSRLERYLPRSVQVVVTLAVVKKVHHFAEAVIKSNGLLIQASEETEEMYSAIDLLIEKIERRARKYKEKLVDHKHQTSKTDAAAQATTPFSPEDRIPQIIKIKRFDLKPMLPEEAVMQMELLDKDFFVFANASSGHISVIYRRKDGNVGLIEPAR